MRALSPLHDQFRERTDFLHEKRFEAIWNAVEALIGGKRLWLTALGRAWPSSAKRKHAIKAADRLLGNVAIHDVRFRIARAAVSLILPRNSHPIVLVDTMEIRHKVVAFTASLAHDGRSLPIWSTTIKFTAPNAEQCRDFLNQLKQVLPDDCCPTLVTDGGFTRSWFEAVELMGWNYVGRVRGNTPFEYEGKCLHAPDLYALANKRDLNLGLVRFPTTAKKKRRLVLSKLPMSCHRQVNTRTGPARDTSYKNYRRNAYEPLLLATSLTLTPQRIVSIYKRRMQIEQSFRDLKNHRWGWSLRHCLTRSRERLEILLMLGSIAMIAQHLVGMAAERIGLHRNYQANTVRSYRVLSLFTLGSLVLRNGDEIRASRLAAAIRRFRSNIMTLC